MRRVVLIYSSQAARGKRVSIANIEAQHRSRRWSLVATIFAVAVLINYPWELAQMPLYAGAGYDRRAFFYCFLASLGDGLLALLIFAAGWIVFRRREWFVQQGARGYLLMLAAGLIIAVGIERVAVGTGQWLYAEQIPRLFGVGLAPIAQMLVLPPLIFRVVAAWGRRSA